jgi:hypothetical protein
MEADECHAAAFAMRALRYLFESLNLNVFEAIFVVDLR